MALTIEAVDEQNIPILTKDYELEIDIGGEPDRAYVDGDMEGFYHTWDPDNAKLWIKSEQVTRLISGAIWNVHLVKGTKTLDAQITYNVVPSAPVIADPGTQKLYRGYRFSLDIDVANRPTIARGSGLLTGLKYGPRGDGADGLNIEGRLPRDANLTEAAFNAAIYAENSGGADNLAVPFGIEDLELYATKSGGGNVLHRIGLNNPGEDISSLASATLSSRAHFIAVDSNYFYVTQSFVALFRVSRTFTDGGTVNLGSSFYFNRSRTARYKGVDVDDNYIYLVDTRSTSTYKGIRILNKSDGSATRLFGFPADNTISNPLGMVVHGDSLIVLDDTDNALYWLDKNTARHERATITKTVNLPRRSYRGMTIVSDTILIVDVNNDQIYEVSADLADGTTLTDFDATYDVPSALQNLDGLAVA